MTEDSEGERLTRDEVVRLLMGLVRDLRERVSALEARVFGPESPRAGNGREADDSEFLS